MLPAYPYCVNNEAGWHLPWLNQVEASRHLDVTDHVYADGAAAMPGFAAFYKLTVSHLLGGFEPAGLVHLQNLDLLQWVVGQGCPWDERVTSAAAELHRVEMLEVGSAQWVP